MRITKQQAELLKNNILDILPNSKVYLFGSRVYNDKKGGDIDLLVLGSRRLTRNEIHQIRDAFWSKFGQQKLDIASFTFDSDDPFKKYVMHEAKEL